MRIAIEWIKSNLITVIAIVVVLAAVGFVVAVPQMRGGALRQDLEQRARKVNDLRGFMNRTVPIPANQPDAPPENVTNVTVNQDVIDKLDTLYQGMKQQYEGVFERAVAFNRNGHQPMLEGLFPRWSEANPDIPFSARNRYVEAFENMFKPYDPDNPDAPRLDAGMPPTQEQVQAAIAQVERDFAADLTGEQRTASDEQELQRVLREELVDMLRLRAEQYHVYANSDRGARAGAAATNVRGTSSSTDALAPYPFQVASWANAQDAPLPHQLWEGQLELWIQQDMVRAIGLANEVDDPTANILSAPVKRLVQIQVVPGYVGLHTPGAARDGSFPNPQQSDGSYPPPVGGQRTDDPDAKVSDNFYVSPTGRVSNALYDVRHALLDVVVDYQRLPELINALARVNFMTVLHVQVEDVDEYQALREGYVYGNDDVVRARLVVETIWLRQWAEPLMPPLVRAYVGLDEPLKGDDRRGFSTGSPGQDEMDRFR